MSDWQVGDLAIHAPCAGCGKCSGGDAVSVPGVLTVVVVRPFIDEPPGLDFSEAPASSFGQWLYCACQFRKIRPDEHQSCEPEFVTLLKRSRKRVSA